MYHSTGGRTPGDSSSDGRRTKATNNTSQWPRNSAAAAATAADHTNAVQYNHISGVAAVTGSCRRSGTTDHSPWDHSAAVAGVLHNHITHFRCTGSDGSPTPDNRNLTGVAAVAAESESQPGDRGLIVVGVDGDGKAISSEPSVGNNPTTAASC